jgi:hypothetical protein
MTKATETAQDIATLLRARNPLLWVVTREETRVEGFLVEAIKSAGYDARFWDAAQGFTSFDGRSIDSTKNDLNNALRTINESADRANSRTVWVLRDPNVWLEGIIGAASNRALRNLAKKVSRTTRDRAQAVIVLSTNGVIPKELAGHAALVEWPLPDRDEITEMFDTTVANQVKALEAMVINKPDEKEATEAKLAKLQKSVKNGARDAAIDACLGLSGEEINATLARSLVQFTAIDPVTIAREKKRVIARERVLEWFDPLPGGLDAVGGLDALKAWLMSRAAAYTASARAYGLPAPKGALVVGIPGTGKSLACKAVATAYGVPLLRLDLGALKSKYVGESEANIRQAFRVIAAIGRCVVWIDEIEKSLGGGIVADGGVSSDALGALLLWMQERQGESFVMATANDATILPPELLRAGRFDAVWFVDLPDFDERRAILAAAIREKRRDPAVIDLDDVAMATDRLTGSEIASLVPDAMFIAFADGREFTTADLLVARKSVVPLSETAKSKIEAMRTWANGRARQASRKEEPAPVLDTRDVDYAAE